MLAGMAAVPAAWDWLSDAAGRPGAVPPQQHLTAQRPGSDRRNRTPLLSLGPRWDAGHLNSPQCCPGVGQVSPPYLGKGGSRWERQLGPKASVLIGFSV